MFGIIKPLPLKITNPSIAVLLLFITLSCQSPNKEEEPAPVQKTKPVTTVAAKDTSANETAADEENEDEDECVRGAAEPIIKKSIYPNTVFKLQQDKTGIETVTFDNGEKLIIRNWGCEYYNLTFRFETERFQEPETNIQFWYKKAVELMAEVEPAIDAPMDIKKGLAALTQYINTHPNGLQLEEQITFEPGEIFSTASVTKVDVLPDARFGIEIVFATGPL